MDMDIARANLNFWLVLEEDVNKSIPIHIKNVLTFYGFSNALVFKDIGEEDVHALQLTVRNDLPTFVESSLSDANNSQIEGAWFFGAFSSEPSEFHFLPDERRLIRELVQHVKCVVDVPTENSGLNHFARILHVQLEQHMQETTFGFFFREKYDTSAIEHAFETMNLNDANDLLIVGEPTAPSRTHALLQKLLSVADDNMPREKPGYRYTNDIKVFATYLRLLSGCYAYETLQKNLPLALPSLSTTNRYVQDMSAPIVEGQLQSLGLLRYLEERKLDYVVAVSEDATRIDGRVQYDKVSNQCMGFVLPTNGITGMPIPLSYPARNADEIAAYFSDDNQPGHFVNVVMAQPLANHPPYCLLLNATNSKYTARDVVSRWQTIERELAAVGIKLLTFASDSDPKNNSAMRMMSMLGGDSDTFENVDWFSSGLNAVGPYYFQDMPHILTKLRNFFLKTNSNNLMLKFGRFYIQISHLKYLLNHFPKDQHLLTASVLNPMDRQNYDSVLRMCSDKVITLLKAKVDKSEGTVAFLSMLADINSAFSNREIPPLQRVKMIWYVVFILRIWRKYVLSQKKLTLKNNFLTQNCYVCIELNAHSLVSLMLYLKRIDRKQWFLPFLFNSQPCEQFFRMIRSFTSTYSTVANCSLKEILGRVKKIQLMNDISTNKEFVFPRMNHTYEFSGYTVYEMPTKEEIQTQISECQRDAVHFAIRFGLLKRAELNSTFRCGIPLIQLATRANSEEKDAEWEEIPHKNINSLSNIRTIQLKNYQAKFANKEVPADSPYVEIYNSLVKDRRCVVKKTSLCWLLRKDQGRLSSDRVLRVRGPRRQTASRFSRNKYLLNYRGK